MGKKTLMEGPPLNDAVTDNRLKVPTTAQQAAQAAAAEKENQKAAAATVANKAVNTTQQATQSAADHDISHAATGIGTGVGKAMGAGTNLLGKGVSSLAKAASDNPLAAATLAGGAGLAYALKRRRASL